MAIERPIVALTRSAEENASLALALVSHDIGALDVPMIEIVVADENAVALAQAIAHLSTFEWLVFTSANGVRAFDGAYRTLVDSVSADHQLRVAVIGPATRSALVESSFGRQVIGDGSITQDPGSSRPVEHIQPSGSDRLFMPSDATAAALVQSFPAPVTSSASVLTVLGELADGTVIDGLAKKGYEVQRVDAYRNISPKRVADISSVNVVAFFSPSAVDRFCELYGASCTAVCIGPCTASQARRQGFEVLAVADPHTEAGVLDQIVLLLASR